MPVCFTRSGTEKEYEAVDRLLQEVADLAREWGYRPPRSAVRSHRVGKGRPVCAAARVARPKNRVPDISQSVALKISTSASKEADNDFGKRLVHFFYCSFWGDKKGGSWMMCLKC